MDRQIRDWRVWSFLTRALGGMLVILVGVGTEGVRAGEPTATPSAAPFRRGIVILGNQKNDLPSQILQITPQGELLEALATIQEGNLLGGRISPDGTRLAFNVLRGNDHKAGIYDIWVMGENRQPERLVENGWVMAWSPDGSQLAGCRILADQPRRFENFLVEVKTKTVSRLPIPETEQVQDWSPDGREFLVTAENPDQGFDHPTKGRYPLRHILQVSSDGTKRVPLAAEPLTDNIWPRYSPDGSLVAYHCRRHEGEKVIYTAAVVRRDGTDRRTLLDFLEEFSVRANWLPFWSPDGKEVGWACCKDPVRGEGDSQHLFPLIFVSADGQQKRRVSTEALAVVPFPDWQ